jgi:hypothetical protein
MVAVALTGEAIMSALTLDEQLIFDVAVALKKVKIPGFRKGVVEEGRFEIAKTIVEYLKSNRWNSQKLHCNKAKWAGINSDLPADGARLISRSYPRHALLKRELLGAHAERKI